MSGLSTFLRNTMMLLKRPALGLAIATLSVVASSGMHAATVTSVPSARDDLALFFMNGQINGTETLELTRLVSQVPSTKNIALIMNSPGGVMTEGLALGRFLYKSKISTFVLGGGGGCASACSIAFLGGRDRQGKPSRTKSVNSELGFHQFYLPLTPETAKQRYTKKQMEERVMRTHSLIIDIIAYLIEIGEDFDKLDLMLSKPGTDLRNVTNQESATYGINVVDETNGAVIEASSVRARSDR